MRDLQIYRGIADAFNYTLGKPHTKQAKNCWYSSSLAAPPRLVGCSFIFSITTELA